jgi:hypothetical protein
MLSFRVFGNTTSLIYNPILERISHASKMRRFWRERVLEREQKRKVIIKKFGIHTLDL